MSYSREEVHRALDRALDEMEGPLPPISTPPRGFGYRFVRSAAFPIIVVIVLAFVAERLFGQ